MRRLRLGGALAALVGLLGLAPAAAGQGRSAYTIAIAEIDFPPLTGYGVRSLDFGRLTPGVASAVVPGPTTPSAHWRFLNVRKNRPVQATFQLPAQMTRGSAAIPIRWDDPGFGYLCVLDRAGACTTRLDFNPADGGGNHTFAMPKAGGGPAYDVDVYVGAEATAPAGLPPGLYSAQVTLTFQYLN